MGSSFQTNYFKTGNWLFKAVSAELCMDSNSINNSDWTCKPNHFLRKTRLKKLIGFREDFLPGLNQMLWIGNINVLYRKKESKISGLFLHSFFFFIYVTSRVWFVNQRACYCCSPGWCYEWGSTFILLWIYHGKSGWSVVLTN